MDEERFKAAVVATIAKRAANTCSNPDCAAITSGPTDDPNRSVSVGEAAHIYGAHPGSARYDPSMSSDARSDSTNAIWLCRTCHKLVDDDESRFPAGLLFEWRREHERMIGERIGKAGEGARQRYLSRHLGEFQGLSYLAEQIITDKPDHWEYKLTAEVLRFKATPILKRWDYLKRGLYTRPVAVIGSHEIFPWFQARFKEMETTASALAALVNGEFQRAWGEPGVAGSDVEIVAVCQLFADGCLAALDYEERVRFTAVPDAFEPVKALMAGVLGRQLDEVAKLPEHMSSIFSDPAPSGTHKLSLTFDLPDDWSEELAKAMADARRELLD